LDRRLSAPAWPQSLAMGSGFFKVFPDIGGIAACDEYGFLT
jgi:hypothetical protein